MCEKETEKVSVHAIPGQKEIQEQNIKKGCKYVVSNTDRLLPQSFGHGICNDVTVQHGNQQSVVTHIDSGFGIMV